MAVQQKLFSNHNYYEMEYKELEEEAYNLVVEILNSYVKDIRRAQTIEEKEAYLNQFKKSQYTQYFDDGTIEYITRLLKKEIYEDAQDNGTR